MQQIMNYLSNKYDIKTALFLATTHEYENLEKWLCDVKGIRVIHLSEEFEKIREIDAIIYDYDCEQSILSLKYIQPEYLIGRMQKTENYFRVWEK